MNCEEIKKLISGYLDDALEVADHQRVTEHLQACADCRAEARAIEKSWELLGTIQDIEPDPNYRVRFWQSVDARQPWPARILQHIQSLFLQRRWVPAAAAAAIVALISVITIGQYLQKPQLPAVLATLNEAELEMVANIDLIEDFEIIEDMDFFSDLDIIEQINGREKS
ncbi:MAG: zf-HC2 domain-containing protein [Desulfobacterales bacterium]|jgi:predicted anti-sigma-YlaC factor YlaD